MRLREEMPKSKMLLTTHLSKDAARAPELETSNDKPFLFHNISCNFSKLVLGGGKCRLSICYKQMRSQFSQVSEHKHT